MKVSRIHNIVWRVCLVFIILSVAVLFLAIAFACVPENDFCNAHTGTLFMWLFYGTPVCILSTLVRTVHVSNSIGMNLLIVIGTMIGACIMTFCVALLIVFCLMGGWA
jgi:hypothetical protein